MKIKFNKEDIRVSFGKPVFFVNEDKRSVTCLLDYWVNPFWGFVTDGEERKITPRIMDYEGKVVAKSKCHTDDEFNVKVGQEIAFARAENKAYNEVSKMIELQVAGIMAFLDKVNEFELKHEAHNAHNNKYINELSGDNNE